MAKKLVLPRIHVMVLCDEIEVSPDEEGVFNLNGVRTRVRAESFPHTHRQLWVYLQMTGHEGTTRCHIQIVNGETDEVVHVGPARDIELEGPLVVRPLAFRLRNCKFPTPGVYYLHAICDGKLLCERLLILLEE
jgi:hypothetical protein